MYRRHRGHLLAKRKWFPVWSSVIVGVRGGGWTMGERR
jgi:hypothetical protein